jgi:hypothetical protein
MIGPELELLEIPEDHFSRALLTEFALLLEEFCAVRLDIYFGCRCQSFGHSPVPFGGRWRAEDGGVTQKPT